MHTQLKKLIRDKVYHPLPPGVAARRGVIKLLYKAASQRVLASTGDLKAVPEIDPSIAIDQALSDL